MEAIKLHRPSVRSKKNNGVIWMKKFMFFAAFIAAVVMCLIPFDLNPDKSDSVNEAESSEKASITMTETDISTQTTTTCTVTTETVEGMTAQTVTTITQEEGATEKYTFRGIVFGADGSILWYTDGSDRRANQEFDAAFANLLSDASAVKLDAVLGPSDYQKSDAPAYLRQTNPTPYYPDGHHPIGQSVMLTVSENQQLAAYNYLKDHGYKGCVLKMSDDGAIRVAASYPSFSHNERVDGDAGSLQNERDAFNNQCFTSMLPGSVFKVISCTVARKNNMVEFDDPGEISSMKIQNWDYAGSAGKYPMYRDLASAILNSSNCVFAQVAYDLGAERLQTDLDTLFGFSSPLNIDGVILTQTADMSSNSNLARCGYGQKVNVSPVFMTAAALAAASTGEMVQPYLADKTYDTLQCTPIEQIGSKHVLSAVPEEYTQELREGMLAVSNNLGLHKDAYSVFTKTGTAAVNHSGYTDFMSIVSVVKDEQTGKSEALMLVVQNPSEFGYRYASNLKGNMQELIDLLM